MLKGSWPFSFWVETSSLQPSKICRCLSPVHRKCQEFAISATCVRTSYRFVEEMGALTQVALIAASCCAGPIRSLVMVVVVACCCCIPYRLALLLALTFAPCTLTFAPCAYGVCLLSTGATIPLAQVVVVTSCNLRWWCFILLQQ